MNLIQQYLADVQQIHSSGLAVKETSYYPALERLFNGVGKTLKPAVFCVINISGGKIGIPDGGFFTVEEKKLLEKDGAPDAKTQFLNAKNPQRGVLEVKGDAQDLARLGLADLDADLDADRAAGALLWQHALAVGYSPLYRASNAGGLAGDWPRVPLPNSRGALEHSAQLGARVAALLDSATPCQGIEVGQFLAGLRHVGRFTRSDGAMIEAGDESLLVTRNWGFFGPRGIVQPGDGTLVGRAATPDENAAFIELGLGAQTEVFDVYAGEFGFWNGVPRAVWETIIGGYPVLKKWLSYRDERVLGRALLFEEAREFSNIIRRLTLLCALENRLDANYEICASDFVVLTKAA